MKLKTLLFELVFASLLIITGTWLYLNSYANAGLLGAGSLLIVLSLSMRARELQQLFSGIQHISMHVDSQSQTVERR